MSEWKAVPVEPTKEMIRAAADYIAGNPTTAQLQPSKRRTLGETLAFEHKAMLAAAPDTHVAVRKEDWDRLLTLATKHCPREHHDWEVVLRLAGVIKEDEE